MVIGFATEDTERKEDQRYKGEKTSNIERSTFNIECGAASRAGLYCVMRIALVELG
jgi:hypothetical protein